MFKLGLKRTILPDEDYEHLFTDRLKIACISSKTNHHTTVQKITKSFVLSGICKPLKWQSFQPFGFVFFKLKLT